MDNIQYTSKFCTALYAVLKLKVPQKLEESPLTVEQLCQNTPVRPDKLQRCLLMLESFSYFQYEGSKWSNTQSSRELIPISKEYTLLFNTMHFYYFEKAVEVMLQDSLCPELAFGKSFYAVQQDNPLFLSEFQDHLEEVVSNEADTLELIDLSKINSILDVGGGKGSLMLLLSKKYPHVRTDVFERPELIPMIHQLSQENNVSIEAIEGDFFEKIPSGYECILMKYVLFNWEDDDCVKILRNCRKALKTGQSLYIVECVMDRKSPKYDHQRRLDVIVMNVLGAKVRSQSQHEELLSSSGFGFDSIVTGTLLSIVKAIAI